MNTLGQRRWINSGLLLLAASLAGLALLEPGKEPPAQSSLLETPADRISRVTIVRPEGETLVFTWQDSGWRMSAPASGWVNPVLMKRVLSIATLDCPRRYPAAGLDLSGLKLEPPKLRLQLNDRTIHFGATTPADGLRYLQIDDTVHLCPDHLYPVLTSTVASFLAAPIDSLDTHGREAQ